MDLESVKGEIERVVVTEEQLQVRLKEIAAQIEEDYKNQDLLLIGVLKGAVIRLPLSNIKSFSFKLIATASANFFVESKDFNSI